MKTERGECEVCGKCRPLKHCSWFSNEKGMDLCRKCWVGVKDMVKTAYNLAVERANKKLEENN